VLGYAKVTTTQNTFSILQDRQSKQGTLIRLDVFWIDLASAALAAGVTSRENSLYVAGVTVCCLTLTEISSKAATGSAGSSCSEKAETIKCFELIAWYRQVVTSYLLDFEKDFRQVVIHGLPIDASFFEQDFRLLKV